MIKLDYGFSRLVTSRGLQLYTYSLFCRFLLYMNNLSLCLLSRFFDLRNGGIGRFSMELSRRLYQRGYDLNLVSSPEVKYDSKTYFLYSLLQIRGMIPSDSSVYHSCSPIEAIYTPPQKTIVTFHDLIYYTNPNLGSAAITSWYRKFVSKQVFKYACNRARQARFVVAANAQNKAEIIQYLKVPEDRIRVIHYGIRDDLEPQPKTDNVFRIGTLSYLYARKRIDCLIRSFKASTIDAELVIGGDGVDKDQLKSLANGDKRIKFLGFVSDDRLADFYNSLDLFVFPTSFEGTGLPIIEAMACKKPVIVLRDAVIPEEIKSRCVILPDLNGMESMRYQTEGFVKFRMLNIEDNYRFAKSFSWKSAIENYVSLYREVSNGQNSVDNRD